MKEALFISWVGMGMVFVGLLALWAMMAVVVKLTNTKKTNPEPGESVLTLTEKEFDLECKQKAAAAAVTAVLALMHTSLTPSPHRDIESMSPWQAAHRSRQFSSTHFPLRGKD